MRIELPNDHWVEVRDTLKGKDRDAVHSVVQIKIQDGQQERFTSAGIMVKMQTALLANIITAWSFPEPIPAEVGGTDAVAELDLDYFDVLVEKTTDLMGKVGFKVPN